MASKIRLFDLTSLSRREMLAVLLACGLFLAFQMTVVGIMPAHFVMVGLFVLFYFAHPLTRRLALALLPFITCFGAIALNCLKKRWWVLGTIALILLGLWFFAQTQGLHDIGLQHAPEVTPDNDLGEGFSITGLGIGYKLSYGLYILSLISAIISLLPFKFNETIEKAVDDTFEDGRRLARNEFNRLESNLHKPGKSKQHPGKPTTPPTPPEPTHDEPVEDKEDPTRFMPK